VKPRELARNQALGRLAIGVGMVLAPERIGMAWVGEVADRRGARVITRALGAREIGLGLGQARAARAGYGVRPWLLAGLVGDAVDLVTTARSREHLPWLGTVGVGAMAGASSVLGAYLLSALD
jgi:hypothetical protein